MDRWSIMLIGFNLIYWSVFVRLASKRAWSRSGLLIGLFHMLIASLLVLGPVRALLEPESFQYAIGLLQVSGRAAFLPALGVLAWSLSSAWLPVAAGRGRKMLLVTTWDCWMAVNIVAMFATLDLSQARIQAGEFFTISNPAVIGGLGVVLIVPFVASGVWAWRQTRDPITQHPGTAA